MFMSLNEKSQMSKFFDFFKSDQRRLNEITRQHARATRRKIERDVCALISRGNISLQHGEYITQEDMETLQQELKTYFSSEQSKW